MKIDRIANQPLQLRGGKMRKALIIAVTITSLLWLGTQPIASIDSKMPIIMKLFGYDRSLKEDIVYFRNGDELRGTLIDNAIGIVTPYGNVDVQLRRCAGLSFEGSSVITEQIVTVNFNVFSGIISNKTVKFRIGSSGEIMDVRKEKIKYVLLKQVPGEQDFIWDNPQTNLFIMTNGDLITGRNAPSQIVIGTDYTDAMKVSFSEIQEVIMQGGNQPTVMITKKNKDTIRGKLVTEDLNLNLDVGNIVEGVYKDKYQRIYVDDGNTKIIPFFLDKKIGVPESPSYPMVPVIHSIQDIGINVTAGKGVQLSMRLIPGGTFYMGSSASDRNRNVNEGPQHQVTINKAFYIGVQEVTQAQWEAVMGTRPSRFGYNPDYPVDSVSWDDCQRFIQKLNTMGLGTYRLPTEAEWEYVCRAGSATRFPWGEDSDFTQIMDYAWFGSNSGSKTHAVGQKKPNAWGIFDMHGNVAEWCADWISDSYSLASEMNPKGALSGSYRVVRGGSWDSSPQNCRSAYRSGYSPASLSGGVGFRIVRIVL